MQYNNRVDIQKKYCTQYTKYYEYILCQLKSSTKDYKRKSRKKRQKQEIEGKIFTYKLQYTN